jgi:glycosyltransferase involved in cell wall biosynthesis
MAPYPLTSPFHCSPLEVIEYMAAGLPVVASRIGKIAEVVYEGCCGILCPAGDAVELADAADALRRDPGLRARLGAAGREAALRRHSWDAVVERILHCAGLEAGLVERRVGLP